MYVIVYRNNFTLYDHMTACVLRVYFEELDETAVSNTQHPCWWSNFNHHFLFSYGLYKPEINK